jgi:hypothetical protein
MTSVERVIEYVDLTAEEPSLDSHLLTLPVQWPIGRITFDNLSFRYSSTSPWVLNDLSLSIEPNEKVTNNHVYVRIIQSLAIDLLIIIRLALLVEPVLVKVPLFKHCFAWLNCKVEF